MKAIKASKRLVMAIVALLSSIILCIGAVLAWFVVNDKVDAEMSKVGVINGEVVSFTVTVHYLDNATGGYNKATSGNVKGALDEEYNVDYGNDGKLTSEKDKMRPYGGIGNNFATAVLYEIHYEIRVNPSYTYRIYASCPEDSLLSVTPLDEEKENFISKLSNVVGYYDAEQKGNLYSKVSNTASSFVQTDNSKKFVVRLKNGIVASKGNNEAGNYEGTCYYIMDYLPDNFIYISSLMISEGGSLNSGLQLSGDLTINLEVYDPENDTDPVPPGPTNPDEPYKSWSVSVSGGSPVYSGAGLTVSTNGDVGTNDYFNLGANATTIDFTFDNLSADDKIVFTITFTRSGSDVVGIKDNSHSDNVTPTKSATIEIENDTATDTLEYTVTDSGEVKIQINRSQGKGVRVSNIEIAVYSGSTGDSNPEPTSKSWSVSVSGGQGVVSGDEGLSVVYYTPLDSDNGGDSNTSKNSGDFKMNDNAATVTITMANLKAGQTISVTITGYTGSGDSASGAKVSSTTNADASSSNPAEVVFPVDKSVQSGTFVFTVSADGTVTIVIVRSVGKTARITGFDITVE